MLKNVNGYLGIRINSKTHKFCAECGYRIRCDEPKIIAHYNSFHNSKKHEWLKFNELPRDSYYVNFEQYVKDPSIKLVIKDDITNIKAGRP